MPQIKPGPFKNFDEDIQVDLKSGRERLTRGQVHRMLVKNGVQHDPDGTLEELVYALRVSNANIALVPPGPLGVIEDKEQSKPAEPGKKAVKISKDGYPTLVPVLRKFCKDNGVKFHNKDKRVDLIKRIKEAGITYG